MQHSQLFQITSIEPVQLILPQVTATAERHELTVEVREPEPFSAPFCGNEYFAQEIRILNKSDNASPRQFQKCMQECMLEIETLVENQLADGYIQLR